jgi:hypothetical protein
LDDIELMNVALNGFPKSWEPFVKGFALGKISQIGRGFGMILSRKRLRRNINKGKGSSKKGNNDGGTTQPVKKKDLSKIKSFACHKNGNYASQRPKNKKGR